MLLDSEVVIINFTFDYNKRYEIPEMTLCNPNKKDLYFIKNIKDLKITMRFLNCSELSFTAYSEINGTPVPYFSKLEKNRLIHVQGFGYFVIQDYKQNYENRIYSKEITAYSAEYLLNNKGINLTFITSPDDSTKTYSKSYKFWDELDRNSENPISLLGNLFLIAPQWKIGMVSTSLWNQYRSFSESNDGLYGFLNNTVSESYSALFVFDFENYLVNVYDTTEIIKKTDVMLTFNNLVQKIEIQELNNDIYTVLNVKGAENFSIARINPTGTKQIFKLDYYVGSLDEDSENYYKNYKDWIEDEDLRLKVLTWEKEVKDQMYNSDDTNSYGYLLEQQNQINLLKLIQESEYADTKTQNESEQILMSTYLDDQSTLTESGKTTMYNYHRKKQYAYEYNMNVIKNGGRLYDTSNDSLFDSNNELGGPTGQEILNSISIPVNKNNIYSISSLENKITEIENLRENIVKTYGYEYYFTSDERTELEPFIREGEYQDSTFSITDSMNIADYSNGDTYVETVDGVKKIKDLTANDTIIDANYVAKQLLDAGYKKIETASVPSFSFSLDSINFFFIEEFKKFAGQMTFGAMINVELEDGEWVYPYLQEITLDYENPDSFSITFGNRFRLSTAEWTWEELHNSTTNAVSSVNSLLSSVAQPVTNGTIDRVTSYINNTLIAANQGIQATSDNEFSFGGYGIRGRKKTTETPNYNGYSGEQIWISNNRICFTDDGWNTSKTVFGKVSNGAYGVVADVLVGNLIAGNNLVISNSNELGESTFYVDASGVKLTNSEILFQQSGTDAFIKMNIDDGIVANNGNEDLFNLNIKNGTLDIKANSLTITGKTVQQIADDSSSAAQNAAEDYTDNAISKISLSVEADSNSDLLSGESWSIRGGSPEGSVTISDDIATIKTDNSYTASAGVLISVPSNFLQEMASVTYIIRLAYKVDATIDSASSNSGIALYQSYNSGDVDSFMKILSKPGGEVTKPGEWTNLEYEFTCKPEIPNSIYISPYLTTGSGQIQIRKPSISPSTNKKSELVLSSSGVKISGATLDLSAYASQDDYTQVLQKVDGLEVNVVKNGEVRTKFAADSSSVTISSGRITFTGNTLVVNSNNFKLNENGTVSITGSFYSSTSNDKVSIYNGVLQIDRKISDGSWRRAVAMFAYGTNASNGYLQLWGPNASGTGQYVGATLYCDYGGGTFGILNSAGQEKFRVLINGDGNAEVWVNGSQKF